jgi:hypothetical protein
MGILFKSWSPSSVSSRRNSTMMIMKDATPAKEIKTLRSVDKEFEEEEASIKRIENTAQGSLSPKRILWWRPFVAMYMIAASARMSQAVQERGNMIRVEFITETPKKNVDAITTVENSRERLMGDDLQRTEIFLMSMMSAPCKTLMLHPIK